MTKFLLTFMIMIIIAFTLVPLAGFAAGAIEKLFLERFAAVEKKIKEQYTTRELLREKNRKIKVFLILLVISWVFSFLFAVYVYPHLFARVTVFLLFVSLFYYFCFSFLPLHHVKRQFHNESNFLPSVTYSKLPRLLQWLDQKQNNHLIPKLKYLRSSIIFFFQFTSFSLVGLGILLLLILGVASLFTSILNDTEILIYTAITGIVFMASWANSITFEEVYREEYMGKKNLQNVKGRVINQKRIIAYLFVALSTFAVWYTDLTALFSALQESGESDPLKKFFISTPAVIFIAFDRFFKVLNDDYINFKNEK